MPHQAVPRAFKRDRARAQGYAQVRDPANSPKVKALTEGNVITLSGQKQFNRRGNWLPNMSREEIREVASTIQTRFQAAQPTTDRIATQMESWESQHAGKWQDQEHIDDEHIFLNKTREHEQTVGAFLHGMILSVPKLVEFTPSPRSMVSLQEDWRKAKLKEALQNYYFDDIWRIRHTLLPDYISTYLKFTTGIIRTDYYEDRNKPDLRFTVCDRALQYIDPYARRMKDAGWWIEREFWSRAAVYEQIEMGHWYKPPDFPDLISSIGSAGENSQVLRRLYGDNIEDRIPVTEDELVAVDFYYQAPTQSREAMYAVSVGSGDSGVGGYLVRYGPNPFAYKGIPFRGSSFDPHEWRVDGTGLVDMYTSIQEIVNTTLNLRLDDLRTNMWSPVLIPENLVDEQTRDDYENRQKLVRVSKEVWNLMQSQGKTLQSFIAQLPVNTNESTQVYQDLAWLIGQGQEIGHIGDVFRGQSPSKVTTAMEIQEVLSANQGVFRPAFMSIMHTIEQMAEISQAYFANPDFYGEERILLATGGRYNDVVKDWQIDDGNMRARAVRFDEMDVEVDITALNAADAALARSAKASQLRDIIGSIGAVEGLYNDLNEKIDFAPMVLDIIRSVVSDVDAYERSPQDSARLRQEREQAQKQQAALQAQVEASTAQAKEGARAQREIQVAQAESQLETRKELSLLGPETQAAIAQIVAKVSSQHKAAMEQLMVEHANTMREMFLEQRLEIQAAREVGAAVSIGTGGDQINRPSGA